MQATNWRAEQAIRPAVVNRMHWGGNRTWHGAGTQQVLMSVIRTARQRHTDPIALLTDLERHQTAAITTSLKIPTIRHDEMDIALADGGPRNLQEHAALFIAGQCHVL